jgi:cytochrome c553
MNRTRLAAALAALLLAPLAHGADTGAGKTIVMQGNGAGALPCMTCHGVDGAGNAGGGFPRLAGMDADYLARQIRDYREGRRRNAIMQPIAQALTDEQAADAAAFYAAQAAQAAQAAAAGAPATEQAATGERLATLGAWDRQVPACESCHGPGGRGLGAAFPGLAGQHASYLAAQLHAWKNGTRANDPMNLMKGVAERLDDTEIQAVAAWFATRPR